MQISPPTYLSILSFNMQVGIGTRRYHEYITRGWRHILPSKAAEENLAHIAELLSDYDIIGLQEVDAGSRRSRYQNQIELLAQQAGMNYWTTQVNRSLGRMAQHGLGLISRYRPYSVSEYKLPGKLPGRGALVARFGCPSHTLTVVVTHLALGENSRSQQLQALSRIIARDKYVVVMGDTNCSLDELRQHQAITDSCLQLYNQPLPSFPSWHPNRGIDHILPSANLPIRQAQVIEAQLSDHCPIAMQLSLPEELSQALLNPRAYQAEIEQEEPS